jgi:hypothetical protein
MGIVSGPHLQVRHCIAIYTNSPTTTAPQVILAQHRSTAGV